MIERWALISGLKGHRVETHIVVQGSAIDRRIDTAGPHQCGQRRREPERAGQLGIVEGLDAESVAHHDRAAAFAFANDEGKHAVQTTDRLFAPAVPSLENDLGVAG